MKNLNRVLRNEEEQNKQYSINNKPLIVEDSENSGLERIIVDRNSFFHGEEVIDYIKDVKEISICGIALGFFITNKTFVETVKNVLKSGGKAEFLLAHPDSEIVKYRDNEEQWLGKLQEVIRTSLKEITSIKEEYPENVNVYLFRGEIHNTIVSTDKVIMINPYVFGKRGWHSPAFIFSRNNSTIVSGFGEQLDEMKKYGEDNPGTFIEIESEEDLKNL